MEGVRKIRIVDVQQMLEETRCLDVQLEALLLKILLKILEILHIETYLARDCNRTEQVDTAVCLSLLLSVDLYFFSQVSFHPEVYSQCQDGIRSDLE